MSLPPEHSIDVQELIEHARRNEKIARTLFEIEVELTNLSDSATFLDRLTALVRTRYELDEVWLVLTNIDSNQRLRASMADQGALVLPMKVPAVDYIRLIGNIRQPILLDQPQRFRQLIPPENRQTIGSMAVLPLVMEDRVVGGLFLGTVDPERYQPGMEAFFLEQLAVKVSIGLTSVWARDQLRDLATRDPLTGLRNRRELDDTLSQSLSRSRRYGRALSILFIDLDDFKTVNDTYGHDCGDAYLCFVADQCQSLLREDDSVFRFAGDEFVVLLPDQNLASARLIGERLTRHFQQAAFHWQDQELKAHFSWGAASSEEPGLNAPTSLMRMADQRLYNDKRSRKTTPQ
ncbi:sensor domain-containing diguanylate cyclase [Marinobacter antarcticus]|uniref:diguanylate cyclase n=2 Tax=root TaxID=1 RepID=A0A831R521_9GAMM|nr:sensor domain-containing diguanylate cyclase [Marinobacter antarcticus]HEA54078.1 sensor domain-containing diguanylate cyclase [Marinobacter antarcticus]